jgi:hypothetical protein
MFGSRVWDGEKLTANHWEKRKRANTESSEIGAQRVQGKENAGRMPALQNGDGLKRAAHAESRKGHAQEARVGAQFSAEQNVPAEQSARQVKLS